MIASGRARSTSSGAAAEVASLRGAAREARDPLAPVRPGVGHRDQLDPGVAGDRRQVAGLGEPAAAHEAEPQRRGGGAQRAPPRRAGPIRCATARS